MLRSTRASLALVLMGGLVFALSAMTLAVGHAFANGIVIWPIDGVILACMLQPFRTRPWAALATGELAFAIASRLTGEDLGGTLASTVISAATVTGIHLLIVRYIGARIATDSRTLLKFLALIVPVSVGTSALTAYPLALRTGGDVVTMFLTVFASTAVGYAVATPVTLLLTAHTPRAPRDWRSATRKLGFLGMYVVLVVSAFAQVRAPLLFLVPFGLIGVAYVCDFAGVAAAVVITAIVSILLTLGGLGPIALVVREPLERNLTLEIFLAVVSGATLPIGALMAEHARLKTRLIAARVEAEAASQAKTTFLATISHEIRTPLNGVLGMAQAMAQDALSPIQRERIKVLRSSGDALVSLLDDVLDLSKIEAGMLTLEAIDFDLGPLLATIQQSYEAIAGQKNLTLEVELGSAAGFYLGDPTRLRQIVSNLVSNALKFTATGGVRVTVAANAGGLTITVSDTGVGIASDQLEGLFQKFRQADASTTRRFGGTGLGLAICRDLAEMMDGTIAVRSREGEGAEFTVRLPLPRSVRPIEPVAAPDTERTRGAPPVLAASLRVLAAEDNAINQLVLRTLLRIAEVDVTFVGDGVEAVARWREEPWDVILMDVQMPRMDGPTATAIIRAEEARHPARPRTPILAVTANTLTHQVAAYLEAGMDDHLAKPISAPALFEALAKHAAGCKIRSVGEGERAVA